MSVSPIATEIINSARRLTTSLNKLKFIEPPVEYFYNPLEYAFEPYEAYVKKYCNSPKPILFVGLNAGPDGMCQTGIPFGEINYVRDWLKVGGRVSPPAIQCPWKPVLGYECQTSEPSGNRLWALFGKISGTAENFFRNAFVCNYCPLAFFGNRANLTPAADAMQVGTWNFFANWILYVAK